MEPEGLKEKLGVALSFDDRQVEADLSRFQSLLDERGGQETGAWSGGSTDRSAGKLAPRSGFPGARAVAELH